MRAKIFPMNASHVQTKHQKQQFTFKFFKKSNLLVLGFCSAGVSKTNMASILENF